MISISAVLNTCSHLGYKNIKWKIPESNEFMNKSKFYEYSLVIIIVYSYYHYQSHTMVALSIITS